MFLLSEPLVLFGAGFAIEAAADLDLSGIVLETAVRYRTALGFLQRVGAGVLAAISGSSGPEVSFDGEIERTYATAQGDITIVANAVTRKRVPELSDVAVNGTDKKFVAAKVAVDRAKLFAEGQALFKESQSNPTTDRSRRLAQGRCGSRRAPSHANNRRSGRRSPRIRPA